MNKIKRMVFLVASVAVSPLVIPCKANAAVVVATQKSGK